jgi:hypothetical protein
MQEKRRGIVTAVHIAVEIDKLTWFEPGDIWSNGSDAANGR